MHINTVDSVVKYSVKIKYLKQELFIYTFSQGYARRKCCRKFCRKCLDSTVPCKAMMCSAVRKLHSVGSMLYKNKTQKRHTNWRKTYRCWYSIESKAIEVLTSFGSSLCVDKNTAPISKRLLKLQPQKTAITHSLLPPDCKARIWYSRWFQKSVFSGLLTQNLHFILMRHGSL